MRVAIIPARGGSRRIPMKNIRPFFGKPIIAYSIQTAVDSRLFDQVVVSTEDHQIAYIAEKYGATVKLRSPELAEDDVGTQEVMKRVIEPFPTGSDYACCIYPCAPMLSPQTLIAASKLLVPWDDVDYVVPVAKWLRDPGQFYFGFANAFRYGAPLIGPRTRMVQIPPETDCDINTGEDWTKAELMFATLHAPRRYGSGTGDLNDPQMGELIN